MKILILGASDSEGTLLPNFSDSWRERLREELPPLIGEPVEIDHRRFYVHLPGSLEYLDRCVRESCPDIAILGATGFAFGTPSVGNRLRRLLGKRVGDWFEERFTSFDRATDAPEGTVRERLNVLGHRLAGATIGREALARPQEILDAYRRCMARLAREEHVATIVLGTTYSGPAIQKRLPKMRALIDRYNAALKTSAEKRHFGWLDRQALIDALPRDTTRPDQMHTGAQIHRVYADALIGQIARR